MLGERLSLQDNITAMIAIRFSIGLTVLTMQMSAQVPTEAVDKYQWLEDVTGERSLAWVKAENARSAKVIESDPRFAGLEASALKVLESKRE
jgi:prolyl oligopeptidase